jgi:hypothetical protein
MDHMIREIICKYAAISIANDTIVKNKAIELIGGNRGMLQRQNIAELLSNKKMMSGTTFAILEAVQNNLGLNTHQLSLLASYRSKILDLRTTAAHAKEATCESTGQSMLTFKNIEYKRDGIDELCKIIVSHEKNILSILNELN